MSWRSVRSWLCTTSQPPPATTTRASAAIALAPVTPRRHPSGSSACHGLLARWEQHGPGGAEAVSLVAELAGPGLELERLVRALEQLPDRRREPARVPRRHDETAGV